MFFTKLQWLSRAFVEQVPNTNHQSNPGKVLWWTFSTTIQSLCVCFCVVFSFVMYNVTEVAIICKTVLPDWATRKMKVRAVRILLYLWLLLDLSIYSDDFLT